MEDSFIESELDELPAEPSIPLVRLLDYSGGAEMSSWHIPVDRQRMDKRDGVLPLLERTWELCKCNDLVLQSGTKKLRCSRLLLMSYSEYAAQKLKNGLRELQLPEDQVPYEGLVVLCAWMDKAHAVLDCAQLMSVLAAATFLRIEDLSRQVWLCLDLPQGIKEERAFKLALEASRMSALATYRGLDTTILRRVQCFFLTLVASREYLQLAPESVCSLLSAELAVNSEREVFFAAVRWLTHDWEVREKYLLPVMQSVRLMQLSTKYLYQLESGTGELMVDLIAAHPNFVELLRKAFAIHLFLKYDDGSYIHNQLYEALHIKRPIWRPFILHPICPYHRHYTNESDNDFTYSDFLAYLRCLQISGVNTWKAIRVETVKIPRSIR